MRAVNKTRYAVLGALLDGPHSGYEIKSLMSRSTAYFWKESDSTIYPILKLLQTEGKVHCQDAFVGKKKKQIFSITDAGRKEFQAWLESPTRLETQRNEFLLKLFFVTDEEEIDRLFQERLQSIREIYDELKKVEERLEGLPDYTRKAIRLKSLKHGLEHIELEIKWLMRR